MARPIRFCIAAFFFLLVTSPVLAQYSRSGMISQSEAGRFGLTRAWVTQANQDRSRGSVANMQLHVSKTNYHSVFEIELPNERIVISERDLNTFREPWGRDGAKEQIEFKLEQLKAIDPDKHAKTRYEERVIRDAALYVVSKRGSVQAIDGESGETRWTVSVGNPNYPTFGPAANDAYVVVINGTTIYCLDASNGKAVWQRKVSGVPGASPAISNVPDARSDMVFAPMVDGTMESYIVREPRTPPGIYRSFGRAMVRPLVTNESVAWPTDFGHLYVGQATKKGIRYRLEANDSIVAPASRLLPDRIVTSSIDGFIYCVHELSGRIVWRFSTGEPISTSVLGVNDHVFFVTDFGNLYSVTGKFGDENWLVPNMKKILGASKDKLYCIDDQGYFTILEQETGARVGQIRVSGINLVMANNDSDRLYFGTSTGTIQCLRETANRWPVIHSESYEDSLRKPEIQQAPAAGGNFGDPAPAGNNPPAAGGGDDNPFGDFGGFGGDPAPADNGGGGGNAGGNAGGGSDDDPFDFGDDPFN